METKTLTVEEATKLGGNSQALPLAGCETSDAALNLSDAFPSVEFR